jgi:hypothetical protein
MPIGFKLERLENGSVRLYACTEDGERIPRGNIVSITTEGYLRRHDSINHSIPIQHSGMGNILIEGEY